MNAKDEFKKETFSKGLLCAMIIIRGKYKYEKVVLLKKGFTYSDYNIFLDELDFYYDNKIGGQNIYGTIWYTDGTWSERAEWDGEEWWDYNIAPEIPQECKNKEL